MTTLFLIRHGLTAVTGSKLYGTTPGFHLDERGRRQAAMLVERFVGVRPTAIYSSPLERCVETVEPLAAANNVAVVTSPALMEMDAGAWTGRSLASLRRTKLWKEVQRNPSTFRFPGGEGFKEAQERLVAEVEKIARRHRRGRVVIATHGDLVRMLLAYFSGTPLDMFQRTIIDAASVSVVMLGKERAHVALVNDTGGGLNRFGPTDAAQPWESSGGDGRRAAGKVRG
jgi:probable phosphomutase (TIGR03848 family)